MGKKKSSTRQTRRVRPGEIDRWIGRVEELLATGDYQGAITLAGRVLHKVDATPSQRADALGHIGIAHLMLQHFDEGYAALSEALAITPDDSILWYNRGLACRFTMRSSQSARDFECALELEQDPELTQKVAEELEFSRKIAEQSRALRGPDFTLEQLIEQEDLFQSGVRMMAAGEWERAEATFRQVITMGDCLPQPWGNVGTCLVMQQRYDEAEIALRRALDMDPSYEFARHNLAALPEIRRSGRPPVGRITGPFDGSPMKKAITFRGS